MSRLHPEDATTEDVFDPHTDSTWPRDLDCDEAAVATLLGWTRRLSDAQHDAVVNIVGLIKDARAEKREDVA